MHRYGAEALRPTGAGSAMDVRVAVKSAKDRDVRGIDAGEPGPALVRADAQRDGV